MSLDDRLKALTAAVTADVKALKATVRPGAGANVTALTGMTPPILRPLRAGLGRALAGTGLASIACLGTSIAAGQGANLQTQSYPTRLRQYLAAAGVPVAGTGVVLSHNADVGRDPRWVMTGSGWSNYTTGSIVRTVMSKCTSGSAVFTSDLPGTVAELYYSNASGAFTVAIDGGTATAVTVTGDTSIGVYRVTGLAATTHTITVARTSGSLYVCGAQVRNTTGVMVHPAGLSGARVGPDLFPTDVPYVAVPYVRDTLAPNLVILNAMTNEATTGISAAQFEIDLDTALAALGPVPVLLVAEIPRNGSNLDAYRAAFYRVAVARGLPVLDQYSIFGTYAQANAAGLYTDSAHPSPAGYATYARAIYGAINV